MPTNGTADAGVSVNELILAYLPHAESYYRKNGRPTSELPLICDALKLLRQHYGMTPVGEFGPLRLKTLRKKLIARGIARKSINQRIGRIKRLFKWGVENELVPPSVHHGLSAVAGLRKGREDVVESSPVKPVSEADVNSVLPYLNRQLRAMVQLEALTGMRPGEVCTMLLDARAEFEFDSCDRPLDELILSVASKLAVSDDPELADLLGISDGDPILSDEDRAQLWKWVRGADGPTKKKRLVVETVLKSGGSCRIADLAAAEGVDWRTPWDDAYNRMQSHINKALSDARLPYLLARHDSAARFVRLPESKRSAVRGRQK